MTEAKNSSPPATVGDKNPDPAKEAAAKEASEKAAREAAEKDAKAARESQTSSRAGMEDRGSSGMGHVGEQPQEPKTKAFRLKDGFGSHFEAGRGLILPGEVVHLNEHQARAFRDKFEAVDDKDEFKPRSANERARIEAAKTVEPSEESLRAQADKASAEAKAAGVGAGLQRIATEDYSHGTITADPAGTAQRL